jgi:cyanophycinase
MRRARVTCVCLLLLAIPAAATAQGVVVAVGGGGTTDRIVAKTLEAAGGRNADVVVLPQSSAEPDAGDSSVKMWLDAGAKRARKIAFADPAAARAALESATLIWIPGGDQTRFMAAIAATGLADLIRARVRDGAVAGGTSAGAAVLSRAMITGNAYDLQALTAGKTDIADGLGVWPGVLVDQHFLKRQRQNRLISAVLDRPDLVGVGIDEATAVFVRGSRIEVVGASAVVVVDARGASVPRAAPGAVTAATGMRIHVLREGMTIDLAKR